MSENESDSEIENLQGKLAIRYFNQDNFLSNENDRIIQYSFIKNFIPNISYTIEIDE